MFFNAIYFNNKVVSIENTSKINGYISKYVVLKTYHDKWIEFKIKDIPNVEFRLNYTTNDISNIENEDYTNIPVEIIIKKSDTSEFKKDNGQIEIFGFKYNDKILWTLDKSELALKHNSKVTIILSIIMGLILIFNGIKKMYKYYNKIDTKQYK